MDNVIIQQDLFETRGSGGLIGSIDTIEIHNVRNLQVCKIFFFGGGALESKNIKI